MQLSLLIVMIQIRNQGNSLDGLPPRLRKTKYLNDNIISLVTIIATNYNGCIKVKLSYRLPTFQSKYRLSTMSKRSMLLNVRLFKHFIECHRSHQRLEKRQVFLVK